jgi:hypothetical protein
MFGQWCFVDGAVFDGDLRVVDGDPGVVELDPLVAALETALPMPTPTPTVPPRSAKPVRILAETVPHFSFLSAGIPCGALVQRDVPLEGAIPELGAIPARLGALGLLFPLGTTSQNVAGDGDSRPPPCRIGGI